MALILAAERCIALNGLAGALLRDIHRMAGQRNRSAIGYHFGSREGLIDAILAHRMNMRRIWRARRSHELGVEGEGTSDLAPLVRLWIEPLARELRPRPEGNFYLRFVDRLRREAPEQYARQVALHICEDANMLPRLRAVMPAMPFAAGASRLGLAVELVQSSLAALESQLPQTDYREADYPSDAIETLIEFVAGALASAPRAAAARRAGKTIDFGFLALSVALRPADGL